MASYEILFKVGDRVEASTGRLVNPDGQILSVKQQGLHLPATELASWFTNGTTPPTLAQLPSFRRQEFEARLNQLRDFRDQSDQWIWENHLRRNPASEDERKKLVDRVSLIRAKAADDITASVLHGIDTVWGWGDLKSHYPILVTGLQDYDLYSLMRKRLNPAEWWVKAAHSSMWKLDWTNQISSAPTQVEIRDSTKLVPMRRDKSSDRVGIVSEIPE